jgi:hypothetical protein
MVKTSRIPKSNPSFLRKSRMCLERWGVLVSGTLTKLMTSNRQPADNSADMPLTTRPQEALQATWISLSDLWAAWKRPPVLGLPVRFSANADREVVWNKIKP